MRTIGLARQIPPRQFVLSLGPRFNPFQAMLNSEFDGLVIADLKVQKRPMFYTPPISSEEALVTNKVDRACNIATVGSTHHE